MTGVARILIVDDDIVDRMAVVRALQRAGQQVEVEEASGCAQALKLLTTRGFDCVFLDYFLPDGSGLDVLRDARSAGVRTPIVILTGQGDEELAVELMKAGASDYLPKNGATPDRISQCLRNALRLYEAERAAALAERERTRLLTLEREARNEAEAAQRRLAFLAEASALVSASLEYGTTLENVARLAVPGLADWCFVDLATPDGGFERVAIAHRDPTLAELASRFRRTFEPLRDAPHGITRVILTGTPEITTETPDWILVSVARDAEHLDLLRKINVRSTMCIPLVARGKTLGAITFISSTEERRYSMSDLAFAEELGRRAALAVDNARLYQDAVEAETRLRRQLEFTSAITASLAEGVCAVDAEGKFTFVNPAAEQLLGWRREDLLGKRLSSTIHLERADGTRFEAEHSPLMRAIAAGRVYRNEEEAFTRGDGTPFPVSYASSPLRADDKLVGAVLVFHDIRERRSAEDRLRFQANLLEAVGQAVIATDLSGRVTYWNRAAAMTYGYSPMEAVGMHVLDLSPPEARDRKRAIYQGLMSGVPWSGDVTALRADGSTFDASLSLTPLRDASGRIVGLIGIAEDISERKQAERELEESRRQMALSEKLSALGTLVSGVAHEIRTPLTYLANNLFLAQARLEAYARAHPNSAQTLADVKQFSDSAMDAVDRINTLVKDLRAYVLPEGGRRFEAGLHDVVGGAVELFRATQRGKIDVEADLQATPPLMLDKGQIQRVAINLLVNAAEAMQPSGGRIWITTRTTPRGAELEVRDEGPGLSPEVEARIFDPFFTTKAEGTGLGLSITRRIVEAHGGTIRHRSKPGHGATFIVTLPASPREDGGQAGGTAIEVRTQEAATPHGRQ